MTRTFELMSCPLDRRVLIEASAGTGKTWTLCMLVLRLLLESGHALSEILIVTFTEAATAELRYRLRARLIEARDSLTGRRSDAALEALLQRAGAAAAERIETALASMDQARISTIHGFCQHVLSSWPLLCGRGFETELLENQAELIREVVGDVWRTELYTADETRQRLLLQLAGLKPETLEGTVKALSGLSDDGFDLLPAAPAEPAAVAWEALQQGFERLRPLWQTQAEAIEALLHTAISQGQLKGNVYRLDWLPGLLTTAAEIFGVPYLALPDKADKLDKLAKLGSEKLQAALKAGPLPQHPFFAEIDGFVAHARELMQAAQSEKLRLQHALLPLIRTRLRERKALSSQAGFDDLLLDTRQALLGPRGEELADCLRRAYPVALIDEFQDTDPIQSEIFQRIYTQGPLFLIGDPKQSIYRFRGADIFAYLQLARQPGLERFSLDTNYRSVAGLLTGCERLFGAPGVFAPGEDLPEIPWQSVRAGRATSGEAQAASPLVLWIEPDVELTAGQAQARVARGVVGEIQRLLAQGHDAREIAVLTRTHRQARQLGQLMSESGLPHLVQAGDPVVNSPEAWELGLILEAVLWPGDVRRLKRALSTRLLGRQAAEIEALNLQPERLDAELERFGAWHQLLKDRPLVQTLPRLLLRLETEAGIGSRLAADADGERSLVNLRQLQELLLEASAAPGMTLAGLLSWLLRQRQQPEATARFLQQIESQKPAVRILTIHASKGLEFPIVFCPWLWSESEGRGLVSCTDAVSGRRRVWIGETADPGREPLAARQQLEARAESLRLAYVALTRARERCYLAWIWQKGPGKKENRCAWSPLGQLLGLAGTLAEPGRLEQQLAGLSPQLQLAPLPRMLPLQRPTPPEPVLAAAAPAWHPRRVWRINSFSRLRASLPDTLNAGAEPAAEAFDASAEMQLDADLASAVAPAEAASWPEVAPSADAAWPDPAAPEGLPGGSRVGSFLHKLLERADFSADRLTLARLLERLLPTCPELRGHEAGLLELIWTCLHVPLDPERPGLRLATLTQAQREAPFYFPVRPQPAGALGRLLSAHGLLAPNLNPRLEPGLLTGRLDLLFGWQGRYHVLDYKSTFLGSRAEDYAPEQLRASLEASGQQLQGLLYSVALHRWLRLRLPGYVPERHLGGSYFLFLRGLVPDTSRGIYRLDLPVSLILELSDLLGGPA